MLNNLQFAAASDFTYSKEFVNEIYKKNKT